MAQCRMNIHSTLDPNCILCGASFRAGVAEARNLDNRQTARVFLKSWLYAKYNYFEIILKLFQCFILHVTMSETEIKLFQPLKLFQNYFSDIEHVGKYSRAAISF